jgi:hypothetical protein
VRAILAGAAALVSIAAGASAQGNDDCFPPRGSNEARMMAIFDVALAFSGAVAPAAEPSGRIHLGLEVSYLPNIDRATAIPTVCRPDKLTPENTDLLFAAPRPRGFLALPAGFSLEASWTPPIRIGDLKANLVGVALARATPIGARGALLGLRAHGLFGVIKAPITCNDAALGDAGSICYQGTRSDDSFKPNAMGVEATMSWPAGRSFRPFMGVGYNHLAPRFQVNFTNQSAFTDRRRVIVNLDRAVLFAGATWRATPAFDLSGEIYSAPADAVTGRVTGRIRLGSERGARTR